MATLLTGAIKGNVMVRALSWQMSARGGLHIFQYPQETPDA